MRQLLSFVIPCYRSADTLEAVVDAVAVTVAADGRCDFEVVLVNDNPPDSTWRLIERLAEERPYVKGACMVRNFGQHAALMAGLSLSAGDVVVLLDDDGQTPPGEAFKLVDALTDDVDAVYADYPAAHKFANVFRRLGSAAADLMACALINKPKGLYLSSFIALRRRVVDDILRYTGPYPYVDGLVLRSSGKVVNVMTEHRERASGSSGYSMKKLLSLWLNGFTAFSVKPLRVATVTGTLFALAGIVVAVVLAVRKIAAPDAVMPGWSSLIVLMLFVGGVTIAMLGLVGEYVGRIYLSLNAAPQYLVRELVGMRRAVRGSQVLREAADAEGAGPGGEVRR